MNPILVSILSSKGAKIGGLVGGSGSIIALIFGLHSDIKTDIASAEARSKEYALSQTVAMKSEFGNKLDHISEGQKELKELVKTIDNRLYNLKGKQ